MILIRVLNSTDVIIYKDFSEVIIGIDDIFLYEDIYISLETKVLYFILMLPENYDVYVALGEDDVVLYIEVVYGNKTWIIYDIYRFLGSTYLNETNWLKKNEFLLYSEEHLDYIKKRYFEVLNVFIMLKKNNNKILSPGKLAGSLVFDSINYKSTQFIIDLDRPVFDKHQLLYKYFLYLKKIYHFHYSSDSFKNYSYFINYKLNINETIKNSYEKDSELVGGIDKRFIQKCLSSDVNFFNNVASFLKTPNTLYFYKNGADKIFSQVLYGGRVEIIKNKNVSEDTIKTQFAEIDFKDAYIQYLKEPIFVGKHKIKIINLFNDKNDFKFFDNKFYKVKIYHNNDIKYLPCLPIKKNFVMYPVGTFVGTYLGEEINLFLSIGGIVLFIYYEVYWDEWKFSEYVDILNTLDNIESTENRFYIKKIKTALWGNLLRNNEEPIKILSYISSLGDTHISIKEISHINSNVFLASYITSKCRIDLYRLYLYFLSNNIETLAFSTDAIYVYSKDLSNLNNLCENFHKPIKNIEYLTDLVFINTKTVLKKKVFKDYYVLLNNKKVSKKEAHNIKLDFFNINKDGYFSRKYNINFSSYKIRIWENNRLETKAYDLNNNDTLR